MAEVQPGRKTLIVYFSLGGNTKALCQRLAAGESAELAEITTAKAYGKGGIFLRMPQQLAGKSMPVTPVPDLDKYDHIVVAGPIWAGGPAMPVRGFFEAHDIKGKAVTGLLTCSGGPGSSTGQMRDMISAKGGICKDVYIISAKNPDGKALLASKGNVGFEKLGGARM